MKELFGSGGDSVCLELPFRCDYGTNIYLGENFVRVLIAKIVEDGNGEKLTFSNLATAVAQLASAASADAAGGFGKLREVYLTSAGSESTELASVKMADADWANR